MKFYVICAVCSALGLGCAVTSVFFMTEKTAPSVLGVVAATVLFRALADIFKELDL